MTAHRLGVDDGLLLFGCICFCVASGLAYSIVPTVYLVEAVFLHPENFAIASDQWPTVVRAVHVFASVFFLMWTAEFAVKISILWSFRVLVRRLPRLTIYLWCTIAFNLVVWAFLSLQEFVSCPNPGPETLSEYT